ncbi:MAG: helix-turn-helix transcriptional regulator [Methanobrevibacter thaueri]|nr:helix-turn-helix transcriptional regulator [Methanobrevibacter thaueri]
MNEIGERMKELRENMGLTQNAVATYLGIPKDELINLEHGNKTLTLSILNKLCNLYGCTEKYLLCKSDEFNPTNFALRSDGMQVGDLKGIATINKIYKNSQYLNKKYNEVLSEK